MSGPEPNDRRLKRTARGVIRVGHRGAAGHAPENTVAAIHAGIACGVEFVEIDLRRTADGALVALHDATVNRTTDGRGRISRLSLEEVKRLDAGHGTGIPTLEEALEAASGRTGLMLELKARNIAQQTVEAVRRTRFKGPLLYASFLHDELTHVRKADPGASLMVLFDRFPPASVARAMKYAPSHVGLRHSKATHRLVEAFHSANLYVFVYTPNRSADIQRAICLGVDGVISNFPDRIPHG
jgi:glycerophosphoryl diester phosphodiesterase